MFVLFSRPLTMERLCVSRFHSYEPRKGHGLPHDPLKALISPRPIGWISSVNKAGVPNLAPYSFFNLLADTPPILSFSSTGWKHSVANIADTGEFVHNVVPRHLLADMNMTSASFGISESEFDKIGLEGLPSDLVKPLRVAKAPASLECKLIEIKELKGADGEGTGNYLVLGEVVRVHIDRAILSDGMVDEENLALLGRLGYFNYASVANVFVQPRPDLDAKSGK